MSRSICRLTFLSWAAAVPIAAQTIELSGPFHPDGEVREFQLTGDGRQALYLADQEVAFANELYRVSTDGRTEAVKLNGPLALGSGVFSPTLFPDETRVAYVARQAGEVFTGLYVVPLDGGAAEKLSGPEGNVLGFFEFSADGVWIVYRATEDLSTLALYSVRADGSGSPLRLNIAGGGNHILDFVLSPDGARVVYRSDELRDSRFELFSVPIDGSSPRVRLHGAPRNLSDVSAGYSIDPSGERVLFTANHDTLEAIDLYSVPIDASAGPTRLNSPLAGQAVTGASISPHGGSVVYRADQDSAGVSELFVVGIDGSSAPLKLSGPMAAGGDATFFEIDPGGARVVYTADQDQNDVVELYSVLLDGSTAPIRLIPSFPEFFTSVNSVRITPDGGTVLFTEHSFAPTFEVQLYAVPIDGSAAPRHLSGSPALGRVGYFALDPSGSRVVFSMTQDSGPDTLLLVPLDGRQLPRAVGSFPRVEGLSFASGAFRVIHRTDQVQFSQARLYLTRLPKVARR